MGSEGCGGGLIVPRHLQVRVTFIFHYFLKVPSVFSSAWVILFFLCILPPELQFSSSSCCLGNAKGTLCDSVTQENKGVGGLILQCRNQTGWFAFCHYGPAAGWIPSIISGCCCFQAPNTPGNKSQTLVTDMISQRGVEVSTLSLSFLMLIFCYEQNFSTVS